jgi:ribonuclease R
MSLNVANKNHGFIKRHPDGYAFFISKNDSQSDVFISAEDLNGAMSNDLVEIRIFGQPRGEKARGRVENILERHFTTVVGRMDPDGSHFVLKDLSYSWGENLLIPSNHVGVAKPGELVLAEILSYPGTKKGFVGKVLSSLGQPSDPAIDVKRVAMTQGIPMEFQSQSIKEVETFGLDIPASEIKKRKDLRSLQLVTIDGATAKDFDDAVFVESKGSNFRLVVAIADVSFYVQPGMSVDTDAFERGTSTYFPNFVIPMLPEGLSNELCSLKPDVDRLAMVADMVIDPTGRFLNYEFYEAVIRSHGRLTYGDVQRMLDGSEVPKFEHLKDRLRLAEKLANILKKKRFDEGSLDLDIPEVLVEVDEQGQAVDIHLSERIFAHRLIEEFMLKANIAVAEFIDKKNKPQMYRVHEEPDILALDTFMRFFNQFTGFKYQSPDPSEICEVLSIMEGKEKNILQTLFLRSMRQAKYSPEEIGHFGLAFSHYAHFTSPIRRYPDLITHRILKSIVSGTGAVSYSETELSEKAEILSSFEQRSVKAERKVKSIKKARFAEKLLGQDFEGSITSVARFGVFITLDQYPLEGMVRIGDLGADFFAYNDETLSLVGQRSGKQFKLGDRVKVTVAQVNTEDGFIDLTLEEHQGRAQSKAISSWMHKEGGNKKGPKFKSKKSKSKFARRKKSGTSSDRNENQSDEKSVASPYSKFSKKHKDRFPGKNVGQSGEKFSDKLNDKFTKKLSDKIQENSEKASENKSGKFTERFSDKFAQKSSSGGSKQGSNKTDASGKPITKGGKVKASDLFSSSHRRIGFGKKK